IVADLEHQRWNQSLRTLTKLSEPPHPQETLLGEMLLSQLQQASRKVESCQAEDQAAASALTAAAEALRSQAEGELCPLCGEPLDPDRLLASTAAGGGGHVHD